MRFSETALTIDRDTSTSNIYKKQTALLSFIYRKNCEQRTHNICLVYVKDNKQSQKNCTEEEKEITIVTFSL